MTSRGRKASFTNGDVGIRKHDMVPIYNYLIPFGFSSTVADDTSEAVMAVVILESHLLHGLT